MIGVDHTAGQCVRPLEESMRLPGERSREWPAPSTGGLRCSGRWSPSVTDGAHAWARRPPDQVFPRECAGTILGKGGLEAGFGREMLLQRCGNRALCKPPKLPWSLAGPSQVNCTGSRAPVILHGPPWKEAGLWVRPFLQLAQGPKQAAG